MPDKIAYSIDEAAEALSLSRSAVKEQLYQGRLSFKRVGRRILIPRWALDAFLTTDDRPPTNGGKFRGDYGEDD